MFKLERGGGEEGRPDLSEVRTCPIGYPRQSPPGIRMFWKASSLNPDWSGPEHIVQVEIYDQNSWALLDSGSTINAVTPEFVMACSLDVGPLSDLVDVMLLINGFGGLFS